MALRAILILVAISAALPAAEKWVRATSPNFELYTSQGEREARDTILYFEQVREFFEKALGIKPSSTVPVRIIVFGSEKQYAPYRPSESAAAFYQPGIDRDYIVLGGYLAKANQIAVHEYMHLVVQHAGLRLPVWLNEGLAEVYSTLQPIGGKVRIGSPLDGHILMARQGWIPLERLLAVDHGSVEYNRRAHAGAFYAESWALTHMLMLDDDYRSRFEAFLQAVFAGEDAAKAIQSAYGRDLAKVESDLKRYVRRDVLMSAIFPVKLERANLKPEIVPIDDIAAQVMQTGILINRRSAETAALVEALLTTHGDRPDVAELAAYAAWRRNDFAKSRAFFEKALEQPSPSPKLYLDAARLQLYSNQVDERGIAWAKKAIEAQPDWLEARIQLAEQFLAMRNYQASLAVVRRAKTMEAQHASRFYRVSAYAAAGAGFLDEAQSAAKLAAKYATDMRDKESAGRLQAYLMQVQAAKANAAIVAQVAPSDLLQPLDASEDDDLPPADSPVLRRKPGSDSATAELPKTAGAIAEGTLVKLECLDTGAKLHIQGAQGPLVLAIRNPERIVVRASEQGAVEMQCGAMKRKVWVEYLSHPDASLGTAGDLRVIEFRQ